MYLIKFTVSQCEGTTTILCHAGVGKQGQNGSSKEETHFDLVELYHCRVRNLTDQNYLLQVRILVGVQ